MTTETDDLSYYETELPKIIAGVRRGEKWEIMWMEVPSEERKWTIPMKDTLEFLYVQIESGQYRVRLAPVPVVKWWDRMLDIPTPCWLASTSDTTRAYLIVEVSPDGVWTSNGGGNQWWTWQRLREPDIRHSPDLCHWSPCVKPEGGK